MQTAGRHAAQFQIERSATNSWPQRKQERFEQRGQLAAGASGIDQAKILMRQLGITGEIEVWSFSMDAVCVGIVFMVLSGYRIWLRSS